MALGHEEKEGANAWFFLVILVLLTIPGWNFPEGGGGN